MNTNISQMIKDKIDKIRTNFPTTQALLIPLLHEIQAEKGWISIEDQKAAADYLLLPLSKVKEVVTFYTMFNKEPVGQVHLQLCSNISCWLNGSEKLMHGLESRLGIACGQTTKDGKYTLSEVECLGSCGTGPVLQVNEQYFETLNEGKLSDLMDTIDHKLKQGESQIGKVNSRGDFT